MRTAIIGCGSMGAWLARELSRSAQVALFDIRPERVPAGPGLRRLSAIEELAAFRPALLVNAVNLGETESAFRRVLPFLTPDVVLADMASIKGGLPGFYSDCGRRFVSMHPMFGPRFADLARPAGENAILIAESDPRAKAYFGDFFRRRGIAVREIPFAEHDPLMAYALTLPFASSIVFSACLSGLPVPGTTFRSHHDIARRLFREEDHLLSEVLFNSHSLRQLDGICSQLEFLKHVIRSRDGEEMAKFLSRLRGLLAGAETAGEKAGP